MPGGQAAREKEAEELGHGSQTQPLGTSGPKGTVGLIYRVFRAYRAYRAYRVYGVYRVYRAYRVYTHRPLSSSILWFIFRIL